MNTPRLLLTAAALFAAASVHAAPFGDALPNAIRYQAPLTRSVAAVNTSRPGAQPLAATAAGDSLLLLGNGFDLLQGTGCDPREWTAEDRATAAYARVWDSYLANSSLFSPERANGAEPMPNAANQVALSEGGAIIKTDSSGVIIADFVGGANGIPRLLSVYPGQNTVRQYGYEAVRRIFDADADPITKGFILSNANGGYIQLVPAGATAGIDIAGKGSVGSPGDTIGTEAFIRPLALAVRANGDIYFRDSQGDRLRMLRRNDLRVVTIADMGNTRPASGTFAQLDFASLQGLSFGETDDILYVHDSFSIVRLDLAAQTFTTTYGPDTRLIGTRFEYSAGSFYLASSAQTQVLRLRNGELTLVMGQEFDGRAIFGNSAGAALGSRTRLYETIGGFGLDSDDAGGVYVATGQAAYHLLADGTVEPLVGRFTSMLMGNHALCFGADSLSAPTEVRNWVQPIGFGNDWSQRATSPVIDLTGRPNTQITLDAVLQLQGSAAAGLVGPSDGSLITIQALTSGGEWVSLNTRPIAASVEGADSTFTTSAFDGSGMFRFVAEIQGGGTFGANARVRVVVNTNGNGSAEDGTTAAVAAAIVDNIRVSDGATTLLSNNFEDGTLQGWTVSARNHKSFQPGAQMFTVHDEPSTTVPRLTSGFDFTDPTCVWNFTDPGTGFYGPFALARLTSGWIPVPAPGQPVKITFSGKLSNDNQARFVAPWVRIKRAGATRPAAFRPTFFALNSGFEGADAATPFTNQFTLTYPTDFQGAVLGEADSIQIVWQIEDQYDRVTVGNQAIFERDSKFPYLDDFRVYQVGIDADADGIADAFDACAAASGAGQDADGDGCVDAHSTMKHVESWAVQDLPVRYSISAQGSPSITDGSDLVELANAAAIWNNVGFSTPPLSSAGTSAQTNASATDGINLVTFEDPDFAFPPGVLAVTPTLSFTRQMLFGDRIVTPGQIVDADLIMNPAINFRTPSHPGAFDLRSVLVHELGHMVGLSHSGTLDATMFFVLQPGQDAASLTLDDEAALAAAYPSGAFATQRGAILGTVTRGSNALPIPGALVAAVLVDAGGAPLDTVATDYTRTDGTYALRGLPAGTYAVRLTPLNGDVGGYPLTAEAVSDRLAATAESNFQPEWRSAPETNADDAEAREVLTLALGQTLPGIDLISNIDVTAPTVVSNAPAAGANTIRIDTSVLVTFSEAVDDATLGTAFKLRAVGSNGTLGGNGLITNAGRTFIFTPSSALQFGTQYEIVLTTALRDREGVALAAEFSSAFTTETQPTVAISDVQPRNAAPSTYLSVSGAGFNPAANGGLGPFVVFVRDSGVLPDTANVAQVSANSFIVQVPQLVNPANGSALTGELKVYQDGEVSNSFTVQFLSTTAAAAPAAVGGNIALDFSPSDAAISPDGLSAIVVGPDAIATVILNAQAPGYRVPVRRPLSGGAKVVVTPDGKRAFITRPQLQDVIVVDADAASGTFGTPRDTIALDGKPNGITLSQSGLLAYVTLQDLRQLVELDVDPASVTFGQPRRNLPLNSQPLGAVAVNPLGSHVWVTSGAGQGLRRINLDLGTENSYPTPSGMGGAAATLQSGNSFVFTTSGAQILFADESGNGSVTTTLYGVGGGRPTALAAVPLQSSLLVANADLNQLQVVSLEENSRGYRFVVASGNTGLTPVSVSVSALGTLALTANAGDRTLSLFALGGAAPPIVAVMPSVARPGDAVSVFSNNDFFTQGTSEATLGGLAVPLTTNQSATGGAFVVPPGPARETTVGLRQTTAGGAVSLTAPITIVPPTTTRTLRSANTAEAMLQLPCINNYLAVNRMQVSPDGTWLAAVMNNPSGCANYVLLYDLRDDGPRGFTVLDSLLLATSDGVNDIAFSPDGKRLVLSKAGRELRFFDTDRTSPTYTNLLGLLSDLRVGTSWGVAASPAGGRYFATDTDGLGGVSSVDATTFNYSFKVLSAVGNTYSVAVTADGRYLVMGGTNGIAVHDNNTATEVAFTSIPGGVGQITLTTDGRRAVARTSTGIVVMNLDPTEAPIGAIYFNSLPPGMVGPPDSSQPGGNGHSVLMVQGQRIWHVDVAVGAVATPALDLAFVPGSIATSLDGRSLWVSENGPPASGPFTGPVLHRYQLSDANAMSLVAGAAQGGAPGATLPTPVRVRLVDANGRPEPGVQVRFTLPDATHGSLDFLGGNTNRVKITDTNGEASVVWTLSPSSVANPQISVDAPILGSAPIVVGAIATLDDADILPAITDIGPSNGASGINTGTELVVRFNQPMVLASVSQTISLTVNGVARAGTFRSEQGGRDIFFRPTSALPFDTECVFSVVPGGVDNDGQALAAGATSTFRTELQPTLSLTAITPPAAATGASLVVSGSGFNAVPALNTVVMNGKIAPVLSASNASLVVRVPQDATSGEVVVQTGGNSTNPVNFIVLAPDTSVGGKLADLPGDGGLRAIAITPDGQRAYATNSLTNTVSALDLINVQALGTFTVGLEPVAITILPDGTRAYIANHGSDDVSVFGTLPASPEYHTVIKTIPVGKQPTAIAHTPDGRFVVVVCEGDSTLRWIDSSPNSGTADLVVTTATALPGGKGIIISPDGTRAYVASSAGIVVIDLATRSVATTVSVASGTRGVAISPDGTIVLGLTNDGHIVVVDVVPGSTTQYRVVTTATASAGGRGVIVSPDGTLCYVIDGTGGNLQAFLITNSSSSQNVAYVPGPRVTLTPSNTIATGAGSSGIAIDPITGLILVTNSTAGTISFIGDPNLLGCVPVAFQFNPGSLNLKSNGKWVKGVLTPVAPLRPQDIDVASIRFMGIVAVDPQAPVGIDTGLEVRFLRSEVELALEAGEAVPVTVSGQIGGRTLCGADTIKVKRGRVTSPFAAQSAQPNSVVQVTWETPVNTVVKYVMLTASYDGGRSWNPVSPGIANTGKWDWAVPAVLTDSAQVAVLWVENDDDLLAHPEDPEIEGTLAVSSRFRISGVTAVTDAPPALLSFARPTPNPVTSGLALMRFGLPRAAEVSLELYDVSGRHLSTLAKGRHDAGWHEVKWSGAIEGGGRARPGLYWARLRVNGSELRQTLVWMK